MLIHKRTSDSGRESGFTLLEVMIAMAILGVGLLSIAVAQLTAIKVASKSKSLQQAMFLAREQMDDLEALPANAPVLQAAATTNDPNNPIRVSSDEGDAISFTRSFQVTPNDPSTGLARVVVTVVWNNSQGGIRQVRLTSVKRMN
jgi:prepilin-type N-terminal cleavage/methylation domain-containing protein